MNKSEITLSFFFVHFIFVREGRKRRMGFGKKGKNSFTVHRSEEILPGEMRGALSRGSSASSDGEGSGGDPDRFAVNANYLNLDFFIFFLLVLFI